MPQGHFCQNGGTDIASVGSDEGQHGTTIASRDMPSFEHGPPFYVEGSPPGTLRSVFTGRARALSLPEEMFQRPDDWPWWIKDGLRNRGYVRWFSSG